MYTIEDAVEAASQLNINFDKFSIYDFLTGINIELEHGLVNEETNVTNNNLILTSKIALAHLNEFSNYYNEDYGLPMFEKFLESSQNTYNKKEDSNKFENFASKNKSGCYFETMDSCN